LPFRLAAVAFDFDLLAPPRAPSKAAIFASVFFDGMARLLPNRLGLSTA
jgi:hypothetical protein